MPALPSFRSDYLPVPSLFCEILNNWKGGDFNLQSHLLLSDIEVLLESTGVVNSKLILQQQKYFPLSISFSW